MENGKIETLEFDEQILPALIEEIKKLKTTGYRKFVEPKRLKAAVKLTLKKVSFTVFFYWLIL